MLAPISVGREFASFTCYFDLVAAPVEGAVQNRGIASVNFSGSRLTLVECHPGENELPKAFGLSPWSVSQSGTFVLSRAEARRLPPSKLRGGIGHEPFDTQFPAAETAEIKKEAPDVIPVP